MKAALLLRMVLLHLGAPPPHSGRASRLIVTEVDRYGVERNRQAEFFFNGIVGHVRSYDGGHINSWDQATRLANYWRRYYNNHPQ
jgi:hypothetical protein